MTTLTGTIENGSTVIPGKLVLTLTNGSVKDTAPKKIFAPIPIEILCPDGVIPGSTDIEETETKFTSYLFEYFPRISTSPDVYADESVSPFPFYAVIPNQVSVDLADLVPTGMVSDVLSTGALRIAKIIANDPALAANIGGVNPRGNYNNSTNYKRGDIVNYLNRAYIAVEVVPFNGVLPTNTSFWMQIPVEPSGSIAIGDATSYGGLWDGSGFAPTQDSLYSILEIIQSAIALKANSSGGTLANPTLTGTVIVPNQSQGDNSTKAANTAYVDTGLTLVNTQLALKANLASPVLTGNPAAPTPALYDNDTSIATTEFVQASQRPLVNVEVNSVQTQTASSHNVTFALEDIDTNNTFSGTTFTAPTTGFYHFGGLLIIINNAGLPYQFNAEYVVNGTIARRAGTIVLEAGAGSGLTLSPIILNLSSGNTVLVRVVPSASISFTVQTNSYLTIMRVG